MEKFINELNFRLKRTTMDIKPLERIGLTKSEIAVYLALLKLGQTTAGPIVDEAKVTRSKIYDILERLKNKGLVSYITKQSTKYFSAANPHNILHYLEEQEKEIKHEKSAIAQILPQLLLEQSLSQQQNVAEIFVGMRGMQNAFTVLINSFEPREVYYAFGAGSGENTAQMQHFFHKIHRQRCKKKVLAKIIFNESSRGVFETQESSPLVAARYMSNTTPAAINIYKNYVVIAILNTEPITILIHNQETADSFREYFEVMWSVARK